MDHEYTKCFDEDREVDVDSDGDDKSNMSTGLSKRSHHNALERKRRDHIKESFNGLRDSVPSLQGEKASRAQILNKATEYIQDMTNRNTGHKEDIDNLKRQNNQLEHRIHALEKAKREGLFSTNQSGNMQEPMDTGRDSS
uniref:Protein max n=1 Tax=Phallusia mammillata TaxID=59560 RepID=A0A6F9DJQ5_9ASCI|nr:protein max-like [Phallusia mammillata]